MVHLVKLDGDDQLSQRHKELSSFSAFGILGITASAKATWRRRALISNFLFCFFLNLLASFSYYNAWKANSAGQLCFALAQVYDADEPLCFLMFLFLWASLPSSFLLVLITLSFFTHLSTCLFSVPPSPPSAVRKRRLEGGPIFPKCRTNV